MSGGVFTPESAAHLTAAATLFWQVQAAGRLLTGGTLDPAAMGEGGRRFVLRETKADTMDDLRAAMRAAASGAERVIAGVLVGKESQAR